MNNIDRAGSSKSNKYGALTEETLNIDLNSLV